MSQIITAQLNRVDGQPWGFRLQGGKDFGTPLVIQKVNTGSIADKAGLKAGDGLVRLNSTDLFNLRHKDAQDAIVKAGSGFELVVQRGGATWKPSVTPINSAAPSPVPGNNFAPVTKTSLAANKPQAPSNVRSITNKQYNTPVAMYSDETIAESLSSQAEVLAGGCLGVNFKKNEKVYNPEKSEVLKALQESDHEPESGNTCEGESAHFKVVDDDSLRRTNIGDDDEFDRYAHYYALASMLKLLNSDCGGNNGNFLLNDKLID